MAAEIHGLLLQQLVPEEDEGDGDAAAHEQDGHQRQAVAVLDLERKVLKQKKIRN